MTRSDEDVAADWAPAGPLRSVADVRIDDLLVLDVLAQLVAADTCAAVAAAPLPLLLALPGVRASAVVVREAARVTVLGSAGYDCDAFGAGVELPLDAGLPVTEAVRTGRTVVRGSSPSWVAVPFTRARGGTGALLLSLEGAPPREPVELARLQRIARALGDALDRAGEHDRAVRELRGVMSQLVPRVVRARGWDVAVRSVPHEGAVGGDVTLCLPDGRGGQWLLVADVSGFGLPAGVVARTVEATFVALAPQVDGPAELLAAADAALRRGLHGGTFVTAVAVHAVAGQLTVSSAGHPPPLLVTDGDVHVLEVEPGLPLALEDHAQVGRATISVPLPPGAVLLLHTDGLTDRRTADGPVAADVAHLVRRQPADDLDVLADAVLAAVEQVGRAGDDVTLMVARPAG